MYISQLLSKLYHKLHFNGHVDLIYTAMRRSVAQRVPFTRETRFTKQTSTAPTNINRRWAQRRSWDGGYLRASARVNALPDAWLGTARVADLFICLRRRSIRATIGHDEEQWREPWPRALRKTASRFSQSVLRTLHVRAPRCWRDSWVESRGSAARCTLWENGRFVSRENNVCRAGAVFTALIIRVHGVRLVFTVLATFYDVVRLARNNAPLLIFTPTRVTFRAALTSSLRLFSDVG